MKRVIALIAVIGLMVGTAGCFSIASNNTSTSGNNSPITQNNGEGDTTSTNNHDQSQPVVFVPAE